MNETASTSAGLALLTSDIVSAYVSKNSVPVADLPALITSVHASLNGLGQAAPEPVEDHKVRPAQIRNSITPDHLVSFVDGKPYKSMKRHLSSYGLTPEQYRQKFGLPADYPMVAPSYAARRSDLAKKTGLGAQRRKT
ncbi:MucR family transcriptional regulator [uncultured Methylobacterium sp.]|uniref:MucR family transcriptional regulator n=1 Tax=uncultured Methylobacterium sp. TaxID=157278 RepID=UPI00263821B0|nr:MucR family transcriptional regulator [uncultured Methylobacterium sp.]